MSSGSASSGAPPSMHPDTEPPGFHPPQDAHPGEWLVVYSFETADALDAWLASPTRQQLLAQGEAFVVGRAREQRVAESPEGVTLVSSVRLRPGSEDLHRALHQRGVDAARAQGGLLRAELLPPVEHAQSETVALLTFTDRFHVDRWLASPERCAVIEAMEPLTEGSRTINVVGGFAGWFHDDGGQPRRWKQALAVLAGLVPVSLLITFTRTAIAPDISVVAAVVIGSIGNVIVLTWIVMPALTRRLSGWLSR